MQAENERELEVLRSRRKEGGTDGAGRVEGQERRVKTSPTDEYASVLSQEKKRVRASKGCLCSLRRRMPSMGLPGHRRDGSPASGVPPRGGSHSQSARTCSARS